MHPYGRSSRSIDSNNYSLRWVAFTSGEAVISVPQSEHTAHIHGGQNGLIFVADTAGVSLEGHLTRYPGDEETTVFQIPTANGLIPPHRVLHKGACTEHGVSVSSL